MANRLPFNALHVFCAVVSHGGVRQAAQALHVTPGAVSKQIRMLEDHLKEVLFDRTAGSLATLTPAGARLYERVATQMEFLGDTLGGASAPARHRTILIDTSVTLAMHWLIPRLPQFNENHPDIRIQVRTTEGAISHTVPVNIFIRRDENELRGLPAQVFMNEHSVLVSSPVFGASLASHTVRSMDWLLSAPRIGMRSRTDLWSRWAKDQGISNKLEPTVEYDNTVLAIQAAIQGLGLLVVPEVFVSAMLEGGALVLLTTRRVRTGRYHFAVGREQDSHLTSAFTSWLKSCGVKSNSERFLYKYKTKE